jgi:hypothetical protein
VNTTYNISAGLFRTVILSSAILVLTSAFGNCFAQPVMGKWRGVSLKNYYSAQYAKEAGASMVERTAEETGNSEIEFLADHSFVLLFSPAHSTEVTTMKGTWILTGDKLPSAFEPKFNPRKTTTNSTISINANTMIMTSVIAPPSRNIKTISTSKRI